MFDWLIPWKRNYIAAERLWMTVTEKLERTHTERMALLAGRLDAADAQVIAMYNEAAVLRERVSVLSAATRCKCGRFVAKK